MKNMNLGFTLVEIMIVVGIVLVLLIIAVPNYLRSRLNTIETAAVSACLTINNSCQLYHINNESFPDGLSDLVEPSSNPAYLDPALASGRKESYEFIYSLVSTDNFTLNANPLSTGLLKGRYFYIDETGVVHVDEERAADSDDPIFR